MNILNSFIIYSNIKYLCDRIKYNKIIITVNNIYLSFTVVILLQFILFYYINNNKIIITVNVCYLQ